MKTAVTATPVCSTRSADASSAGESRQNAVHAGPTNCQSPTYSQSSPDNRRGGVKTECHDTSLTVEMDLPTAARWWCAEMESRTNLDDWKVLRCAEFLLTNMAACLVQAMEMAARADKPSSQTIYEEINRALSNEQFPEPVLGFTGFAGYCVCDDERALSPDSPVNPQEWHGNRFGKNTQCRGLRLLEQHHLVSDVDWQELEMPEEYRMGKWTGFQFKPQNLILAVQKMLHEQVGNKS
jgi:hypothetical protein